MNYGLLSYLLPEEPVNSQQESSCHYVMVENLLFPYRILLDYPRRKRTLKGISPLNTANRSRGDVLVVSELLRIGRSLLQGYRKRNMLVLGKQSQLIILRQQLEELNVRAPMDAVGKLLQKHFWIMRGLVSNFISQPIKASFRDRKAKGARLGKPKGAFLPSIFNRDEGKILSLYSQGIPLHTMVGEYLSYGTYLSLKKNLKKRLLTLHPVAFQSEG